MSKRNIYKVGKRDIIGQCEDYVRHVDRMTAEGLHEKGDIAAELAHRDIKIRELKALLAEIAGLVEKWRDDGLDYRPESGIRSFFNRCADELQAALEGVSE